MQKQDSSIIPIIKIQQEESRTPLKISLTPNLIPTRHLPTNTRILLKAVSVEINGSPAISFKKSTSVVIDSTNQQNKDKAVHIKHTNEVEKTEAKKAPVIPNYLILKGDNKKLLGMGNSIPYYPQAKPTTPSTSTPVRNRALIEDAKSDTKEQKSHRSNSAFKSKAEKKWNWGGKNGAFDNPVMEKWKQSIKIK